MSGGGGFWLTPAVAGGIVPPAGQIGGTVLAPDIRGLRETAGPTLLTLGALADGQDLRRSGANLIGSIPPYALVYQSAAANALDSTFTKLPYDTVIAQSSDNPFSVATNQYTAPRAGRVAVTAVEQIPAGIAYSELLLTVYKNGVELVRGPQIAITIKSIWLACVVAVAAADTLEVRIFQTSGGTRSVGAGALGAHAEFNYLGV